MISDNKNNNNNENIQIGETYSAEEYDRHNTIPRSQLFSSRLQLELEKQVAKMELVEVDLLMDPALVGHIVGVDIRYSPEFGGFIFFKILVLKDSR